MTLKTLLFKLRIRKLREGDFIIVKADDKILRTYRVIGQQFKYGRTKGVAVLGMEDVGFRIVKKDLELFGISEKYLGSYFGIQDTTKIKKVY